jgi:polyisoprenoid-binding protein YceI
MCPVPPTSPRTSPIRPLRSSFRPPASTPAREGRDEHLRSADFFDVETYPEIRFVSSAIDEVDEGSYIVTGELTIRDMTKTVSVPLELIGVETDPFGNLRAGLEGSRRIDRKDWGVTWNTKLDSGGVLVSDKITLEFELSLIKNARRGGPCRFVRDRG